MLLSSVQKPEPFVPSVPFDWSVQSVVLQFVPLCVFVPFFVDLCGSTWGGLGGGHVDRKQFFHLFFFFLIICFLISLSLFFRFELQIYSIIPITSCWCVFLCHTHTHTRQHNTERLRWHFLLLDSDRKLCQRDHCKFRSMLTPEWIHVLV